MPDATYETIDRDTVEHALEQRRVDNEDQHVGVALVNVLGTDSFAKEHIPDSINIPKGAEERFEERFAKDKEIIVYCASPECDASPTVAQRLAERGFENVKDYAAGMSDWKAGDGDVAHGAR